MDTACVLPGSATTAGVIDVPGGNVAYQFQVTQAATTVDVSLTELPADYDLYLVDGSGSVLNQSVNEGLTPESIDMPLPNGTYWIFVHADVGRDVAPGSLFLLQLSTTAQSGE